MEIKNKNSKEKVRKRNSRDYQNHKMKTCEWCKKEIKKEEMTSNQQQYHKKCSKLKQKEISRKWGKKNYPKNKEKWGLQNKKWREKHKEELKKKDEIYRRKNKEKILEQQKKYEAKPETKEIRKKWVKNNREKVNKINKKSQIKHRDKILKQKKDYYQENKEEKKEKHKKHYEKIKDDPEVKAKQREYVAKPEVKKRIRKGQRRRYLIPKNRIHQSMSVSIRRSLKSNKNGRKWEKLVGYTKEKVMKHLEKQFDSKMNWDNYCSYWEIDHIKPQSLFNFTSYNDKEFKECWALSNLQPLEATENHQKGNRWEPKNEIYK